MSATILLALRILITGVLYLFVGWALWLLWQDIRKRTQEKSMTRIPTILLSMEEEPGSQWQFNQSQLVIGRDPVCDCKLEDPTISARHARLIYQHGHWWVEDLNSRNGTKLNLQAVSDQVVLTSEDILQCGKVDFRVWIQDASHPAETQLK